ncbi:MAG TPA: carboxymuconolactone decarboxylase family protein [Acidimicrobiales bacterium]|nr:carboxymuconolactone decarboxylase family protein [Acidimicrobiales bacterium]
MDIAPVSLPAPRLDPLAASEWDEFLARLAAATPGGPETTLNIFATLGRHRELFRRWIGFGGALLSGVLPPRTRELAILRTAANCRADYEWAHHVPMAGAAGVSALEIDALSRPLGDHHWDPADFDVLRAVDEMHQTLALTDGAWAAVHDHLGDDATIELIMLVGQYHLVALVLRTLGIEVEEDLG